MYVHRIRKNILDIEFVKSLFKNIFIIFMVEKINKVSYSETRNFFQRQSVILQLYIKTRMFYSKKKSRLIKLKKYFKSI